MDLFIDANASPVNVATDVYLLKGFALNNEANLFADVQQILSAAPLRHMMTPMGFAMSAAMTNCGPLGWVSDRKGYRYDAIDPISGKPWPAMPESFLALATQAATAAGFTDFVPDACLINQYKIGASMGLHQDKNEVDFNQPIVSVSLGLPAVFLFGGLLRSDKPHKVALAHGDVLVWGGKSRLNFHGIRPVKASLNGALNTHLRQHLNHHRVNLTLRKAA